MIDTDDDYFDWLYFQVANPRLRNPSRTFFNLTDRLNRYVFVSFVPNDDNRAADGVDLRHEFASSYSVEPTSDWYEKDCSVLEMLIALSRRLSFEAEGEPRDWFWELLENLGLHDVNDRVFNSALAEEIDEKLYSLVFRTYLSSGYGGLFPLQRAERDQRKVEIWYQMNQYLLERD